MFGRYELACRGGVLVSAAALSVRRLFGGLGLRGGTGEESGSVGGGVETDEGPSSPGRSPGGGPGGHPG